MGTESTEQPLMSPYGLIQESLWPDRWFILVSCVMLNCTRRKQVEKVFPSFMRTFPTPEALIEGDESFLREMIAPLGFKNRRTKTLRNLAMEYMKDEWKNIVELPGVGEYASRAWEIFVEGNLGGDPPRDGALMLYWTWRKRVQAP